MRREANPLGPLPTQSGHLSWVDQGVAVGLLDQFFGCYFHQDWPEDDSSWRAVVARYRAESVEGESVRVADEIAKLIQQYPDDAALAAKLDQLGCYFWPGNPSLFRGWLSEVEDELR